AHKADGAERNLRTLGNRMVLQDAEFEAAAAEIGDATWLRLRPHRGEDSFAAEARFFPCTDNFEGETGGFLHAMHERIAVLRFAGGAGGHGAVFGDAELVHDFA